MYVGEREYDSARAVAPGDSRCLRHRESLFSLQGGKQHETDQEPGNAIAGNLANPHRADPVAQL